MEFFNFSFPFSIRAESRANAFLPFIFSLSFYSIPPGEHNLNTCKYKYHNAIITQMKKKRKKNLKLAVQWMRQSDLNQNLNEKRMTAVLKIMLKEWNHQDTQSYNRIKIISLQTNRNYTMPSNGIFFYNVAMES